MKSFSISWLVLSLTAAAIHAQPNVVERGAHYKIVQTIRQANDASGRPIGSTNRYTVLGNGMNYKNPAGNWIESAPTVRGYPNGIICTGASYRVILSSNLNTSGSVDVETTDHQRIISHPLGIAFFDPDSGQSVLLASIKDCQARVWSNRVVYADAFAGHGIEAAITYSYEVGRFHQDVTFVKGPSVTPAQFGMSSRTRLEVISEILESPEPVRAARVLRESNAAINSMAVEPQLVDETLGFGKMVMGPGRAFPTDSSIIASQRKGVPVAKRILNVEGRTVLVEAVPWTDVKATLEKLPRSVASATEPRAHRSLKRELPKPPVGQQTPQPFETRIAEVTRSTPTTATLAALNLPAGLVLDYEMIEGICNVSFSDDTTYLINSQVALSGTTTFGSGVILKYGSYASLNINGNVNGGDPVPPLLITSKDDDSVGDIIDGSTGSPAYSAFYALSLECLDDDVAFEGLSFRHCYGALSVDESAGYLVSAGFCRMYDCGLYGASVSAGNVDALNLGDVDLCNSTVPFYSETASGTVGYASLTTCGGDWDHDGLSDVWEQNHFGNLNQSGAGDYDHDGVTNLDEHENGTNPNTIAFRIAFETQYANSNAAPLQLILQTGAPAEQAVMLDSQNFASANWTTYLSSNLTVNLGTNEGWHNVCVGLRSHATNAQPIWQARRMKLDRTSPQLIFTGPTNGAVCQPMIQLPGYCAEALSSLRYDLSNAVGLSTNQLALVLDEHYDPGTREYTTNTFQAFDVDLANGPNHFTFRAIDLAGNVSITQFTVARDYSSDTNAPSINLYWPQNNMLISGSNFTWRGFVNDFTAHLAVSRVAAGVTNSVIALIERDGNFWAEDLPLSVGTNVFSLVATDAAGNSSATNVLVIRTSAALSINAVPESQLNQPKVTVTGAFDGSGYSIWVNGIKATLANGEWQAEHVPLPPGGAAIIQARAIPNSDNNGNGTGGGGNPSSASSGNPSSAQGLNREFAADKPWALIVDDNRDQFTDYTHNSQQMYSTLGQLIGWVNGDWNYEQSHAWANKGGGDGEKLASETVAASSGNYTNHCQEFWSWPISEWPERLDGAVTYGGGCAGNVAGVIPPPKIALEHCDVIEPTNRLSDQAWSANGYFQVTEQTSSYTRSSHTSYKLFTGGRALPGRQNLWAVNASATEILDPKARPLSQSFPTPYPVGTPVQQVPLQKVVVGELGKLGSDGILYVALPDNVTKAITVKSAGVGFYLYDVNPTKHKLFIEVNNVILQPDRVADAAKFCVGQKLNFSTSFSPPLPEDPQKDPIQWAFEGTFKNQISPPIESGGSPFYSVNTDLLTHESTSGWWTSGNYDPLAAYAATLGEGLLFSNGQRVAIAARGLFGMHRPRVVNFTKNSTDASRELLKSLHFFEFESGEMNVLLMHTHDVTSSALVGTHGYSVDALGVNSLAFYSVQVDSTFAGVSGSTQTIEGEAVNECDEEIHDYPAADGFEFYDDWLFPIVPGALSGTNSMLVLADAPFVPCGGSFARLQWDFLDYIRFKPDAGPGPNIFVTLGFIEWHAHGSTVLQTNSATGKLDYVPFPTVNGEFLPTTDSDADMGSEVIATDMFPFWTHITHNRPFGCPL